MDRRVFFPTNHTILGPRDTNQTKRDPQFPKSTAPRSCRHLELNSSSGSRMSRFKENSLQMQSNGTYSSRPNSELYAMISTSNLDSFSRTTSQSTFRMKQNSGSSTNPQITSSLSFKFGIDSSSWVVHEENRNQQRRNNFGITAAPRPENKRFSMQSRYYAENPKLLKTLFEQNQDTEYGSKITDSKGGLGLPHLVKRNQPLNLSNGSGRRSTISKVSGIHSGSSHFSSRKAFTGSGSSMWSQLSSTLTLKQKLSRRKHRARGRHKMGFRKKMRLSFGLKGRRFRADSRMRLRSFGRNLKLNALVNKLLKPDVKCVAIESLCPIDVLKAASVWNAKAKREHRERLKAYKESTESGIRGAQKAPEALSLFTPTQQITTIFIPERKTYFTLASPNSAQVIQHYLTTKNKMVGKPQPLLSSPKWFQRDGYRRKKRGKISTLTSEHSEFFDSPASSNGGSSELVMESESQSLSRKVPNDDDILEGQSKQRLSGQTEKIKSNITRNLNMRQGSLYGPLKQIRADSHQRVSFNNQHNTQFHDTSIPISNYIRCPKTGKIDMLGTLKVIEKSVIHNIFGSSSNHESLSTLKEKKILKSKEDKFILSRNLTSAEEMALFQLKKNYIFVDGLPKAKLEHIQESKEEESVIDSMNEGDSRFRIPQHIELALKENSEHSLAYSKSAMIISNSGGTNNRFQYSQGNSKVSGTLDKISVSGAKIPHLRLGSGERESVQSPLRYKRTLTETVKPIKEERKRGGKQEREVWWSKQGTILCAERKEYKSMRSEINQTPPKEHETTFQLLKAKGSHLSLESQGRGKPGRLLGNEQTKTESSELIRDTEEILQRSERKIENFYRGVSQEIQKEKLAQQQMQNLEASDDKKDANKFSFFEESIIPKFEEKNGVESMSPAKEGKRRNSGKDPRKTQTCLVPENTMTNFADSLQSPTQKFGKGEAKNLKINFSELMVQSENQIPIMRRQQNTGQQITKKRDLVLEFPKIPLNKNKNKNEAEVQEKLTKTKNKSPVKKRVSKRRQLIAKRRKKSQNLELEVLATTKRNRRSHRVSKSDKLKRFEEMQKEIVQAKGVSGKRKKRFKLKKAYKCNCKGSNCIQAYCICFKNGSVCSSLCKCNNCLNHRENMTFAKEMHTDYFKNKKNKSFKLRFETKTQNILINGKVQVESTVFQPKFNSIFNENFDFQN